MPYKILPLTTLDIRSAVQLYLSSFAHNAHSLACFPRSHTPSVRAWWEAMLGEEISEEGAVWLKAVTTTPPVGEGQGEGEMASFAKWVRVPPKPSLEEGGGGAPTTWPEGADERICKETFGVWAQRKREIMGARGHWCMYLPHTHPPSFNPLNPKICLSCSNEWTTCRPRDHSHPPEAPREGHRLADPPLGSRTSGRRGRGMLPRSLPRRGGTV